MIRIYIPGFSSADNEKEGPRFGDSTVVMAEYVDVIDGYCGIGTTRLIRFLKNRNINAPYLHITHPHYDHYYGIRKIIKDKWFKPKGLYCQDPDTIDDVSEDVKSNKRTLRAIISEAEARGIPVIYVTNGSTIKHGSVNIKVYRDTDVTYKGNSDAYLNDGSLCYWFPDLKYLTTGDAGLEVAKKHGLKPVFIKIGHHGNDCVRVMATWLKNNGCLFCWDNDYNVKLTDFLMTGREDCLAVGMQYFNCHGDINILAYGGKVVIYKDKDVYQYPCSYKGKATLGYASVNVIEDVIEGKYSSGNARITALINAGYWPSNVQNHINKLYRLIKG